MCIYKYIDVCVNIHIVCQGNNLDDSLEINSYSLSREYDNDLQLYVV